jgi:mRNA interferase MazF
MKTPSNLWTGKILNVGDVYTVNLDPTIGDEIRKLRPVVILNGGHEKHLKLAIVAPVTQWKPAWEQNPFFVVLSPNMQNGLQKKSVVDCFQIRAISHQRFVNRLGVVSREDLDRIRQSVALILDIDSE